MSATSPTPKPKSASFRGLQCDRPPNRWTGFRGTILPRESIPRASCGARFLVNGNKYAAIFCDGGAGARTFGRSGIRSLRSRTGDTPIYRGGVLGRSRPALSGQSLGADGVSGADADCGGVLSQCRRPLSRCAKTGLARLPEPRSNLGRRLHRQQCPPQPHPFHRPTSEKCDRGSTTPAGRPPFRCRPPTARSAPQSPHSQLHRGAQSRQFRE